MKRLSIAIVLVAWLILVGYAMARSLPAPSPAVAEATVTPLIPGPMPTARVPNELTYYTKRCWPACHYDPSWISEEPPRMTETFDSAPGADWTWISEDASRWSLEETPGALHIAVPGSSIREKGGSLEDVVNALAHEAPAPHFDVMVRVVFDPADVPQSAGVLIEMEDGSVLSLAKGHCAEGYDPACVGEGVTFDGLGAGCDYTAVPISADRVDLMLRKAGNSYIGYYHLSEPGETEMPTHVGWEEVGRCYNRDVTPERVGIAVSNGGPGAAEAAADFELVTLVERK
jgi:hypothetical protein